MALVDSLVVPLACWPHASYSTSVSCHTPLPDRGWTSTTTPSCCLSATSSSQHHHVHSGPSSRWDMGADKLWREFFSDPSQWWDNRSEKVNPRYSDFKHKKTQQSLRLDDSSTPPWVKSELAAMPTGSVQSYSLSWPVRLRNHVKSGEYRKTLNLFQQMDREGVILDKFTFVPVLTACSKLKSLEEGRHVHEQIIRRGCESDQYVATCLVNMYAKCGNIQDAWNVFNKMRERDVISWNTMIGGYVKSGQGVRAIQLFRIMQREGVKPSAVTFVGVLNACASVAALEEGRRVHEEIIRTGCESNIYVANCLVDMYAKCRSIEDAQIVFEKMRERDVVSWNVMIRGWVKSARRLKPMIVLREMRQEGLEPDAVTFVGLLNACASVGALGEGRSVHEEIIRRGYGFHVHVVNCLVDMYAKCGSVQNARSVFNEMQEHDVVSWNGMIGGYAKSGQGLKAVELFKKMRQGVDPNAVTFIGVLNACASLAALEEGRIVHEEIVRRGYETNVHIATCLVDMYSRCGSIDDARSVFDQIQKHNVFSWNAMIGGYLKCGQGLKALELFRRMRETVKPDAVTFVRVLNACARVGALEEGRRVHAQIIERGHESDVYVANCLVDMYAKCGSINDAWSVFNKMRKHNVVSWNAMIGGFVNAGQGLKAVALLPKMEQEGVDPDPVTFVGLLNGCASIGALEEGKRVHEEIIRRSCECNTFVANCLVDMYAKCRSIGDAWSVFQKMREHDVVSWNAIIGGHVKCGQGLKALELVGRMRQEGVEPDIITFVGILNACASVADLEEGRRVHAQIIQRGYESDVHVANCLVDMYAKCGSFGDAWNVFKNMRKQDIVSWNAIIGGCVQSGEGLKAMVLIGKMRREGVEPDAVTFVGWLNACASIGALQEGQRVHEEIIAGGCESDVYLAACLIDMYAKCGSIEDAVNVFNKIREQGVFSWNAMIGGYALHGQAKKAIELFKRMGKEGVGINGVTFTCLLSACSHGGLLKEGLRYFKSMISCYNVLPTTEHYTGMVDLLGRAGWLEEAEKITRGMNGDGDADVWMSLLGACKIHGNIKMAEQAAKRCWERDPENASGHVLVLNK